MEIKVAQNGPYLIPGPLTYTDAQGRERIIESKVVALCRCGHSAEKPFCDGSHKRVGFVAEEGMLTME